MVWPLVPKHFYGRLLYRSRWRRAQHTYGDEFAALAPLVTLDKNVIDCGAHVGILSRFFAERSRGVDAYEPNPFLYDILSHNCPTNVRCHNVALSDREGACDLVLPCNSDGRAIPINGSLSPSYVFRGRKTTSILVRTVRLDDQNHREVSLLKIDVEGHELSVIRGAASFLAEERPHLWIEIEQRFYGDRSIRQVFEEICRHGYDGFFFLNGTRTSLDDFDPERHQSRDADYVANFLFVPREKHKMEVT